MCKKQAFDYAQGTFGPFSRNLSFGLGTSSPARGGLSEGEMARSSRVISL